MIWGYRVGPTGSLTLSYPLPSTMRSTHVTRASKLTLATRPRGNGAGNGDA